MRTPVATTVGGIPAAQLHLGADATPIDVVLAFDSIWVVSHHLNAVIRLDPSTLVEQARVAVGSGPGWFVVTDDALWVTHQLGRGLSRIDPVTNTAEVRAGMWPSCFAPVEAFGSIWHTACDAHQVTRIDPTTYATIDITVGDQAGIVLAGDLLVTSGPLGLAQVDPTTNTIRTVGGPGGRVLGFAGGTVWTTDDTQVFRVDPTSGEMVSKLPIEHAVALTVAAGHVWLTQESTAILKIDIATGEVLQTVSFPMDPVVAVEAADALWVTSYGGHSLWRLTP